MLVTDDDVSTIHDYDLMTHYRGGRPHGQVIIMQMLVIDDDVSTIIMILDI